MEIREDDLTGATISELLEQHLAHMQQITPPASIHAFGLDALRGPEMTLWSAWQGEELLGCGALRELNSRMAELKAMRTVEAHRGKGVASAVLQHLIAEAARRGYQRVYLETGAGGPFASVRAFYERHGFEACGPFGSYADDPNSAFMMTRI